MNILFVLLSFLSVAFASSTLDFDKYLPKNDKAVIEFKKTVDLLTQNASAISDCKSTSTDFDSYKACISKIANFPKVLVESFDPKGYTADDAIQVAMNAYSAALTKQFEVTLLDNVCYSLWFLLFSTVGVLYFGGFFLIIYVYFTKEKSAEEA